MDTVIDIIVGLTVVALIILVLVTIAGGLV
jgi:hypothetical protein